MEAISNKYQFSHHLPPAHLLPPPHTQLRHPSILAFRELLEVEERGEAVIYVITEPVTPLAAALPGLNLDAAGREAYLTMGLHQAVAAIAFLNADCGLVHGGLCAAAVAVTDTLDWKLHAFDLTGELAAPGHPSAGPLAAAAWALGAQYKCGELARGDWAGVRAGPVWAVDAWGLGCLMREAFAGAPLQRTEDLRDTAELPAALLPLYQKLLASQPPRRLDPARLARDGALRNRLVELCAFLENLSLKDSAEKEAFFKRLPTMLPSVPRAVATRKLLPLLGAALEFGGAPPAALAALLALAEGLPPAERAARVTPVLVKLLASPDRGVRRALLEHVPAFGPGLPDDLVESTIYKSVEGGFSDANPYLRELTLKAMAVLGPKLSQRTLASGLLRHLAKAQVDEEPAIRANATVLLGALAPHLGEATARKVLLNAFARALRDPFPPARAAALRALLATAAFHAPADVAVRVVPMAAPLCADPEAEVRASALRCVDHFVGALREHAAELDRAGGAAAEAAAAGGVGAAGGGLLTSFGWAVSSLAAATGGAAAQAQAQPAHGGGGGENGGGRIVGFGSATGGRPPSAEPPRASPTRPAPAAAASRSWDEPAPRAAPAASPGGGGGAGGGWGDDDDDDPFEDMVDAAAAEAEARKRLSRAAIGGSSGAGAARPRPGGSLGALGGPPMAAARPASGGGGGAPARGMKLGAAKKPLDAALLDDDFAEW
jgi:SCY1-like protein 1